MNIFKRTLSLFLIIINFNIFITVAKNQQTLIDGKTKIFDQAKKSIVTIESSASLAAYDESHIGSWSGTGFVLDKRKGILLTNAHIVGRGVISNHLITFHNGKKIDAKLFYYDPWLDYAVIKVDPKLIPEDVTEVRFSKQDPQIGENIFIIGNNEGQNFSMHSGTVSGLYRITGQMPQHSINMSMNTKGGSSGSPIFNEVGEAIALNYAVSQTFAIGLHPQYLHYAIKFIQKNQLPIRKHIGAIFSMYSLDEAVRFRSFPEKEVEKYIKKYPHSLSNAIQVESTLQNTPAENVLMVGDIIWEVNGKQVGPNLIELDLEMNYNQNNSIELTLFRKGAFQKVMLNTYDLETHKIDTIVYFGGATFFEADDFWSRGIGVPPKTLTFSISQPGTSLNTANYLVKMHEGISALKVLSMDHQPLNNLTDLVKIIPTLIEKKYFPMHYINYLPFHLGFDNKISVSHNLCEANIHYQPVDPIPRVLYYNSNTLEWEVTNIVD